jgi:hypothetical protein
MRIDIKDSRRQSGATQPAQKRDDCRALPLDELKRQLGLNLIEAARDQSGNDAHASFFHNRR